MGNQKAWVYGVVGWLIPGAGHLVQRRVGRGLMLGGGILAMFFAGQLLGGNLFSITDSTEGILPRVFGLFDLGNGLLYLVSWLSGIGFSETENVQRTTFEYGNTLMMVAGLLNYLAMLDAFDIGAGRKP